MRTLKASSVLVVKLWDPSSGMTPKWAFGVAMLPVGASRLYQAHFERTALPKWPLWAHLFYSVFYSVSELRRACFRQARVTRAVLPPGALFRTAAFAFPPCASTSHMCPLSLLGVFRLKQMRDVANSCEFIEACMLEELNPNSLNIFSVCTLLMVKTVTVSIRARHP